MFKKSAMTGFSLLEMLVVMAILAILAAIAIPSYSSYIQNGNRSAAQSFLLEVDNRQKQYFLDARSYASTLSALSMSAPADVSDHYTISIDVTATPPAFTLTATPKSDSSQAGDGALTLSSDGSKTYGDQTTW